jgi:hypothetical protein
MIASSAMVAIAADGCGSRTGLLFDGDSPPAAADDASIEDSAALADARSDRENDGAAFDAIATVDAEGGGDSATIVDASSGVDASCDPPRTDAVFVDPLSGADVAGNGSGTAGGSPRGSCAFKTITYALGQIAAPATVNVVDTAVVSAATNGETFPIHVPAGVTVTGASAVRPVATLTKQTGFLLEGDGAALRDFTIVGTVATVGVSAQRKVTMSGVEVEHAATGVQVLDFATLTIVAGAFATSLHDNSYAGLIAGDYSSVQILGGVAGATAPIHFDANGTFGIVVGSGTVRGTSEATLVISGTPMGGIAGTVTTNGNAGGAGVSIQACGSYPGVQSAITGLVSANNRWGLESTCSSPLKVRQSVFVQNERAAAIISSYDAFQGVGADFGTAGDPGLNLLQWPATKGVALCWGFEKGQTATLNAVGNRWQAGPGGTITDCNAATSVLPPPDKALVGGVSCWGTAAVGGFAFDPTPSATSNTIDVSKCQCAGADQSSGLCR